MRELARLNLFGRTAQVVIERYSFLLARLLQLAETLELGFQRRGFALQSFLSAAPLASGALPLANCSAYSRSSRFRTSGPLDFLRPPVSMRPW